MSDFNWESFLRRWSQQVVEGGNSSSRLPVEVVESKWLGFPGATEELIGEAEERLGVMLPLSYREFLKVTNGWRQTTPFINRLWSVQEVEWFRVRHQPWIDAFVGKYGCLEGEGAPSISDAEYLVYGEAQDCSKLRCEYLSGMLEISRRGEGAIYLLNPQVVAGGEWEAWFFGDWLPGADRYRSFEEMMRAEYENFLEQLQ